MSRSFMSRQLLSGLIVFAMLFTSFARAAEPKVELLWPAGASGAKGSEAKDQPQLIVYTAPEDKATGAAVVICPGGGYGGLALGHEGHDIAQWLNSFDVSAFICDYRHRGKGYGHPAPLQDAQRAIRTVHAKAAQSGDVTEPYAVLRMPSNFFIVGDSFSV